MVAKKLLTCSFLFWILSLILFLAPQSQNENEALAKQYFDEQSFKKAAILYEKLYITSPNKFYQAYFDSLIYSSQFTKAKFLVKQMIAKYPKNFKYKIDRGLIFKNEGKSSKYEKYFKTLLATIKNHRPSIYSFVYAFYKTKDVDLILQALLEGRKVLGPRTFFNEIAEIYTISKNKEKLSEECFNYFMLLPHKLKLIKSKLENLLEIKDYGHIKSLILSDLQEKPLHYHLNKILLWVYLKEQNYDDAILQSIAIDNQNEKKGREIFELASTFDALEAYPYAIKCYQEILDIGPSSPKYLWSKLGIITSKKHLLVNSQNKKQLAEELESAYQNFIALHKNNINTVRATQDLAYIKVYYLEQYEEAIKLLEDLLKNENIAKKIFAEIKIFIAKIKLIENKPWESLLLFGQVEVMFPNEPIEHEAKFLKAQVAFFQGEFKWSNTQLEVLKASTSQLIANDALQIQTIIKDIMEQDADMELMKQFAHGYYLLNIEKYDDVLKVMNDLKTKLPPLNVLQDDILYFIAQAEIKLKAYNKAKETLTSLLKDFPYGILADDANWHLAQLYEKLLDNQKAIVYYKVILENYPNSIYLHQARKKIRILRGEKIFEEES